MSPSDLCPTCLEADMVISTFSFDPNLSQAHRISFEEMSAGHLSCSSEQHGHLLGGELRSSGMPHKGYADPISERRA